MKQQDEMEEAALDVHNNSWQQQFQVMNTENQFIFNFLKIYEKMALFQKMAFYYWIF